MLDLPTGVIDTTMYTHSQLVTMAIEAPLFRDRLELISEGYKNGMARKDKPCGSLSVEAYTTQERCTHVEEVVKEDEPHSDSIGDITSDSKSYRCYCKAHRTSRGSEEHQLVATNSFNDKVCHGRPEHPLHGVGCGEDK